MLSVIICTYNRAKYIYGALERLAGNDFPKSGYEIVLVDNNCTDNTKEEVDRFAAAWPDVTLKRFVETKQGLSYARNRGISEASGDVLLFLDDDAFVQPDYLANIHSLLVFHPEIECFGGSIIPDFENGEKPAWLCRWNRSWVSAIDCGDSIARFRRGYPIGANMGFRKTVFERVGVFNTELGRSGRNLMGGEEKDLFNRIGACGIPVWKLPSIAVHHVIPESRTTLDYVRRLGEGVGASEKIRCQAEGGDRYVKRIVLEGAKWGASCLLWLGYTLLFRPVCAKSLVLFRRGVTKGLLGK